MKILLAIAVALTIAQVCSSCALRPIATMPDSIMAIEQQTATECGIAFGGVQVWAEGTRCPDLAETGRWVAWQLDRAHMPPASIFGSRVIFVDAPVRCGVFVTRGCTIGSDMVVTGFDSFRHELGHVIAAQKWPGAGGDFAHHRCMYWAVMDPSYDWCNGLH